MNQPRRLLAAADREIARAEHGLRVVYQRGCRCLPCRAAEARYRATLRRQDLRGEVPLGRTVPAGLLWRRVRTLILEGLSEEAICRALGVKALHFGQDRVTVGSQLRVERLYRRVVGED